MRKNRSAGSWASLYADHAAAWEQRFADACAACGIDGTVVFSGAVKYRHRDDLEYPFFAEPYFKAWVPHAYPGSAVRIVPGETPLLVYLRDEDFWHMPAPEPTGFWTDRFEIRCVSSGKALLEELDGVSRLAGIGEEARKGMGFAKVNDPTLLSHLDYTRAFKTPYEVACMEEASRVGALGHAATQRTLAEAPSEFELNEIYCRASGQRESALPYQNIVALNEHAGILHYQNLDRQPPAQFHSFLLDAGGDCNGYASDITRTWTSPGDPFADLIDSLDAMQQQLCAEARSGTSYVFLNDRAHQLLAEVLVAHGIARCSADECYERGITRAFLPHGLGHLLGLQVHDAGGRLEMPGGAERPPPAEHPFLRLTRTLEPGFVVTVEPGLYFIPALLEDLRQSDAGRSVDWERVAQWLPYGGIRVEDDVLVTETGSRNLTRPALKSCGLA